MIGFVYSKFLYLKKMEFISVLYTCVYSYKYRLILSIRIGIRVYLYKNFRTRVKITRR